MSMALTALFFCFAFVYQYHKMDNNFEQTGKKSYGSFFQLNFDQTQQDEDKCAYFKDPSTYQYSPVYYENNNFTQNQYISYQRDKINKKSNLFQFKVASFQKSSQYEHQQNKNSTFSWNNCRILKTYDKILQKYLQKINLQKDQYKNSLKFTNCSVFSNLQLQQDHETLKEKIGKTSFSYFEKNKFIAQMQKLNGLMQFLQDILKENYFQISIQILYFVKLLLDCFKQYMQNYLNTKKENENTKRSRKCSFEFVRQNLKDQKNTIQLQMRGLLQHNQVLNNIYYSEHINYLNLKKIKIETPLQIVKFQFENFIKSLTKIIVKLIAVDLVNIKEFADDLKLSLSKQNKQKYGDVQENDERKQRLKINFINSYRSLNSVASVNIKQLNLYESKPDLWSESDSQQNQECLRKKKRKLS